MKAGGGQEDLSGYTQHFCQHCNPGVAKAHSWFSARPRPDAGNAELAMGKEIRSTSGRPPHQPLFVCVSKHACF